MLVASDILTAWWERYCLSGLMPCAPQTPPTISSKEQDILFLLELKQPLSLFLSPSIITLLFFVYFRQLITLFSVGKLYRYFRSIRFSLYGLYLWNFVYFFVVSFSFMMAIYLFRFYMWGKMNCLLISLRDRLSYVTQSDRNLWKIN